MKMKKIIFSCFISLLVGAVEQVDTKKTPFETDRSKEVLIKEKVNFQQKINNSLAPSEAQAESTEGASSQDNMGAQVLNCKSAQEVRQLELVKKGSGCEVIYTKKGASEVIANQKLGTLRCDDVFRTLQEKLVKVGFKCESK